MLQDKDALPQPDPVGQPAARRRSRIYYGWYILAAAAVISVATAGVAESSRLLLLPMRMELELGMAAFAGAIAIGQLMNGVTQPIIGYLFDRFDFSQSHPDLRRCDWPCHRRPALDLPLLAPDLPCFGFVLSIAMGGASLGDLVAAGGPVVPEAVGIGARPVDRRPILGTHFVGSHHKPFLVSIQLARRLACSGRHHFVPGPCRWA